MLNRLAKELGCVGTFKQPDPPWTLHVATAAVASASPTLAAETAAVAAGVATPSELRAETPCKEHPAPTSSPSQRQHVHGGAVVPQACVLLPADGSDRLEDQSTAIAELNQVLFDSRIGTPYIGDGGAGEGEVSSPAPATRLAAPAPARKIVCIVAQSSYDAWCTSRRMPLGTDLLRAESLLLNGTTASCKEPALKVPYVVLTTWTPLDRTAAAT
eukprot:gene20920-31776_t